MKYLVIENQGQIEPNAFALMGASTKRGSDTAIGMFGTGTKYALAVLLENGIAPVVISGDLKIKFSVQDATLGDNTYKQVVMQVRHKKTPLNFTTSMGLHWGISHALRELVSNAIDAGSFKVEIRNEVIAKDGVTRILIPYQHEEVISFYKMLDYYFVLNRSIVETVTVYGSDAKILKPLGDGVRIYRRGVLVYADSNIQSAYDYDVPSIAVREDRTADKWNVLSAIPPVMDHASVDVKKKLIANVVKFGDKSIEGISSVKYYMASKEWAEALDGKHVATTQLATAHPGEILARSDVVILPEQWAEVLTSDQVGGSNAKDLLTTAKLKGFDAVPPEQSGSIHAQIFAECLEHLERAGVYESTNPPKFQVFTSAQKDAPWGEYVKKEDLVLINVTCLNEGKLQVFKTLAEELLHRSSGYGDDTRQFQNAIFGALGTMFCKLTGVAL